jgi:hypothetical protein
MLRFSACRRRADGGRLRAGEWRRPVGRTEDAVAAIRPAGIVAGRTIPVGRTS